MAARYDEQNASVRDLQVNMNQSVFRKLLVWATATAMFGGSLFAQAGRVDDRALKNAAKNADEWLTYGRDYAETHYSPLKQIDTTNVKRLGLAPSLSRRSLSQPPTTGLRQTPQHAALRRQWGQLST